MTTHPLPDPVSLLADLVAFDTTSRNSNLQIIDYIKEYLDSHGVQSYLLPNAEGDKCSLFATIGTGDQPGIGLSAHTDVVPVDGQNWTTDPFQLKEKGDRLYGRGSCDMKGFLACVLAKVPDFISRNRSTPVHLVFSYDEEIGCTGVRPLIDRFNKDIPLPRIVIVGEPTSMKVVDAHKSINVYATTVTGFEAHSSAPQSGVNAVMFAAELIAELTRIRESLQTLSGGDRFTPPYTSLHVGTIKGGTALNIVPRQCEFVWEYRSVDEAHDPEVISTFNKFADTVVKPKMRSVVEETNIETRQIAHAPIYASDPSSTGVSLAMKLAQQNETQSVSYATEAGLFENANCSTVVCGPGNIREAHKPDEYIERGEIDKCMRFLDRLADMLDANEI